MAKEPDNSGWRRNAAAVIVNSRGQILLGKDAGRNAYWHFPQGGVRKNEDIAHALAREVWEEVGLRPSEYTIERVLEGLRYEFPASHSKKEKWLGQEQTYFLLRCKNPDPRITVNGSPEFSKAKWIDLVNVDLRLFRKFKRDVARQVLEAFFPANTPARPTVPNPSHPSTASPMNTYLINPGRKLDLRSISPGDRSCYDGSKEESLIEFDKLRNELQELQKKLYAQSKHRVLIVFQAMDAGGKDGCVKHVFSRIDPQGIRVVPFKKPTPEELARDFLWRVHKEVPANGEIVVFNRSHYEDIIAVRVKKLFPDAVWKRRYRHILDFEDMLAEEGTTIIKIFLHISKQEQKARLESRLHDPNKLWKFHMDDLDDRNRWDEFQLAYADMIQSTSKTHAPWYVIPSDRKWYRNLMVAKLLVDKLRGLNLAYPQATFDPTAIKVPD